MAIVSMRDILLDAQKNDYAIGQFNINGKLWAEAILASAQQEQSPVIVAASDRLIDFLGGFKFISTMIYTLVEEMAITVPVVLHLDHGKTIENCLEAIDAGFTSVMIDGSHFSVDENIKMTKKVVGYAHEKDVSVEAEIGTVGGNEDGLIGEVKYADIEECIRLTQETHIDALAAALGSVHGKYQGEPKLGFKEMKEISQVINLPLVLHGASGIPDDQIKKAIQLGHAKINFNTELNIAWSNALRDILYNDKYVYEPQSILLPGKRAIENIVREKIQLLGSNKRSV